MNKARPSKVESDGRGGAALSSGSVKRQAIQVSQVTCKGRPGEVGRGGTGQVHGWTAGPTAAAWGDSRIVPVVAPVAPASGLDEWVSRLPGTCGRTYR